MRLIATALFACTLASATTGRANADDAPPTPPTGLISTAYSGTAGAIRWQRATDDRGAVAGYEVERDGVVLGTFDALSYVDRTLTPGRTYLYRVTSIDGAGQRSLTRAVSLVAASTTRLDSGLTPSGLRAEVYSGTAAELFWQRSATPALRYIVQRGGQTLAVREGTSFFEDGLARGKRYDYTVTAVDARGVRSPPAIVSLVTPGPEAPRPPSGLRASIDDFDSAEIFWERVASRGQLYEVRRDGVVVDVTDGFSYQDSSLQSGQSYLFEVITISADGRRSEPASIGVTPSGAPIPNPPTGVRAKIHSASAVEIFWDRVPVSGARTDIVRYEVSTDNGRTVFDGNGTSDFIDDLLAGETYEFEIVAVNRDGQRSAPSSIGVTMPGGVSPSSPSDLRAQTYSDSSGELLWSRVGTGVSYEVRRDGVLIETTTGNSHYDDDLSRGQSYRYEIVTVDAAGRRSPVSSVVLNTYRD